MKQRLANEYSNGQCPDVHNISNACLKYLKFLYFIFFSQNTNPMVVTFIRDGMEAGRGREGRSCGIRTCTCCVIYTRQRQPGELIEDQSRDTTMNQPEPRKKFPWREGDSIYSFVQILSDSYYYNFKILKTHIIMRMMIKTTWYCKKSQLQIRRGIHRIFFLVSSLKPMLWLFIRSASRHF